MKRIKFIITISSIYLLMSCSDNKDLEGYWYGEFKFENKRIPALVKFEKDTLTDFFNPYVNSVAYKRIGNRIYYTEYGEEHTFKIKLKNGRLSTYSSKTDSLSISLKRRVSKNFIFD